MRGRVGRPGDHPHAYGEQANVRGHTRDPGDHPHTCGEQPGLAS